jgi:hypothetical protein
MIRPERLPSRRLSRAALGAGALLVGTCVAASGSAGAMTGSSSASKSPAQTIAAAESALRSAHGYVIAGDMHQGKEKLTLRVTFGGSSKLEFDIGQGAGTAAIIALPGGAYVKANKAYWNSQGGGAIVKYANRWIQLPASYSNKFAKQLGKFNPKTLATCLDEDHGKFSSAGTTTVNGKRAVVVRDAGGVPGGNPGTFDIASTDPAYPLRVTSTGPTLKGGKVDVCNDGKGSNLEGTLTLSRFNDPPVIKAPANPVKINTTKTV